MAHRAAAAERLDSSRPSRPPTAEATEPGALGWVREPQQDRSKRTLTRLLDAAEEIIRTRGVTALTVPAVAQAAQSSVGSFYGRFRDKEALLRTLHERACEQSVLTAQSALDPARWEGVPTASLIRAFVSFSVRLFAERRPMMLAFSAELASDPGFAERRARAAAAIAHALLGVLLPRRNEIGHPNPELAVSMALRMVTSVLEQRNGLDAGGVAEVVVTDEVLSDELTRAMMRYLELRA
ncbi:Transcriptional regulator, TetR family protein [Minicystis rosea]|nr:Transcriptional regulator, TetR family protein [Minicystis rosea]